MYNCDLKPQALTHCLTDSLRKADKRAEDWIPRDDLIEIIIPSDFYASAGHNIDTYDMYIKLIRILDNLIPGLHNTK